MPTRCVVLLRGINVGRNKRIAMADLRRLLKDLGYIDVTTLLQSGNAVLTSPSGSPDEVQERIERGIEERTGLSVRCVARTAGELSAVIDANPLGDVATDGSKLLGLFLSAPPAPELLADHDPVSLAPDQVALGDRVIYQWCPDGVLAAPPVAGFVEKHLGVVVTGRNWNTITKLGALLDP